MENKEIEIGDYVRTEDGHIFKLLKKEIDEEIENSYGLSYHEGITIFYTESQYRKIKHSKNITNLIETGDIVILEYYVAKYKRRITRKFTAFKADKLIEFDNPHCDFLYDLKQNKWLDGKGFNIKIKEILTKEQFSANSYKVGE